MMVEILAEVTDEFLQDLECLCDVQLMKIVGEKPWSMRRLVVLSCASFPSKYDGMLCAVTVTKHTSIGGSSYSYSVVPVDRPDIMWEYQ